MIWNYRKYLDWRILYQNFMSLENNMMFKKKNGTKRGACITPSTMIHYCMYYTVRILLIKSHSTNSYQRYIKLCTICFTICLPKYVSCSTKEVIHVTFYGYKKEPKLLFVFLCLIMKGTLFFMCKLPLIEAYWHITCYEVGSV